MSNHDLPEEPVLDLFVGGPRDGFTSLPVVGMEPHTVHIETGSHYLRAPEKDTPTRRIWEYIEPPKGVLSCGMSRLPGNKGLTLAQLEQFVKMAKDMGHHPDAEPITTSTLRGYIKDIAVKGETPGPTAKK